MESSILQLERTLQNFYSCCSILQLREVNPTDDPVHAKKGLNLLPQFIGLSKAQLPFIFMSKLA